MQVNDVIKGGYNNMYKGFGYYATIVLGSLTLITLIIITAYDWTESAKEE